MICRADWNVLGQDVVMTANVTEQTGGATRFGRRIESENAGGKRPRISVDRASFDGQMVEAKADSAAPSPWQLLLGAVGRTDLVVSRSTARDRDFVASRITKICDQLAADRAADAR